MIFYCEIDDEFSRLLEGSRVEGETLAGQIGRLLLAAQAEAIAPTVLDGQIGRSSGVVNTRINHPGAASFLVQQQRELSRVPKACVNRSLIRQAMELPVLKSREDLLGAIHSRWGVAEWAISDAIGRLGAVVAPEVARAWLGQLEDMGAIAVRIGDGQRVRLHSEWKSGGRYSLARATPFPELSFSDARPFFCSESPGGEVPALPFSVSFGRRGAAICDRLEVMRHYLEHPEFHKQSLDRSLQEGPYTERIAALGDLLGNLLRSRLDVATVTVGGGMQLVMVRPDAYFLAGDREMVLR